MDVQPELRPEPSGQGVIQSLVHEPLSITKRNDEYFFDEDPMAIFQVEDALFKVHQHHLARESEYFREIFAKHNERKKNEQPTELQGVTIPEFERLLDYFYKPHVARDTQGALDLLSVSHKFQMSSPLQHSKKKLDANLRRQTSVLTPLQMLILGDQYGFEDWTATAYEQLLSREGSLSEAEAIALGFDRLVNLVETREEQLKAKITSTERELLTFVGSQSSTLSSSSSSHPGITFRGWGYGSRGGRRAALRGWRGSAGYARGRGRGGGAMPGITGAASEEAVEDITDSDHT